MDARGSELEVLSEDMEQRIRGYDWSTTPLGPIQHWPQSLRTVVNILLSSRYQMWMAWGPELTMVYNDAYAPTLGIKHPKALGRRASEVWHEIWPEIGPLIETVLSTGKATYDAGLLLFLERSGFPEETYHTFSYSPLADDHGRIAGMLCVVSEETERVIGERRVETLRDVASVLATTKTVEEVCEALSAQLGSNLKDLPFTLTYLFDDAGGARLACSSGIEFDHPLAPRHIEPDSDFPWPAQRVLANPAVPLIENLSEQKKIALVPSGDWNKSAHHAAIVPIRQQGQDQPAGFFVAGTNPYRRYDIAYTGFVDLLAGQIAAALNNARAYEAERRRAEALAEIDRAKTTFFSNVSHELRTPLTLMLNPVEELLGSNLRPADHELLELVHRNGLRLQKLVNALLDFSRIEAGRMRAAFEPTDLSRLTTELAANFRSAMERAGLDFQIHCGNLPEPVYVDHEMWEKIVLNLLSNALKFTLEGCVQVALTAGEGFAELTVGDTGTGIPESELPHIFERFHRVTGAKGRTIEGTGIGLALVQELVKLHGGSITAESELSKGTRFAVRIPFGAKHLPSDQVTDRSPSTAASSDSFVIEALRWLPISAEPEATLNLLPPAQAERILLADDNADMREYITRLLSDRYWVTAVANGQEALDAALADPPDLILSDVMMPRLDGFQLLEEIRNHPETKTIPVIFLSARAGEESRVEGLGAGADDYLIKPFTARELLARVGAHLAIHHRRKESEVALSRSNEELRQANADLEQFAYSASHDLQEPLRQVAVYSQLLEKKYARTLDGKGSEYLAYCIEGAHRMEMLISGLLAYSQAARTSDAHAGPVSISEVLDTVQKNLSTAIAESGAEISVSEMPVVHADVAPLVHLFQNLISNALKYRRGKSPRVNISATRESNQWRFAVEDNGIGIPKEFQSQIFGIFKRLHDRTEYPGTGIGLAICQKIVERYNGRIWVESEPGHGSTFFFTLEGATNDR
jgi:signal transduction histidine kinase